MKPLSIDPWQPIQYERFSKEREEPFEDLVARIPRRPAMRVVDLGCGTGELTRRLHERMTAVETLGLDTSEQMLERARTLPAALGTGELRFEQRDAAGFVDESQWDLVFSNAALHWLPSHEELFPRLSRALVPGGLLAVQMPANHDHVSQQIIDDVADEEPFPTALRNFVRPRNVLTASRYAEILHGAGLRDVRASLVVYGHELSEAREVVEWVKGSTLTSFQRVLDKGTFDELVARYETRLRARLGDAKPYYFTFDRILLWATRPG